MKNKFSKTVCKENLTYKDSSADGIQHYMYGMSYGVFGAARTFVFQSSCNIFETQL